ncbi:MAG: hypothetical protein QM811_10605 [Pirellulales bacterium]
MQTPDTARLSMLVELKVSLLERLVEIGRAQLDMIDDDDYTRLLQLLGVKQRVLGGLQDVERAMTPFRDEDPETRVWSNNVERRRCRENLDRCEALLGMIMDQERTSETRMVDRRDVTAAELRHLQQATDAHAGYSGGEWNETRNISQLDLASEV